MLSTDSVVRAPGADYLGHEVNSLCCKLCASERAYVSGDTACVRVDEVSHGTGVRALQLIASVDSFVLACTCCLQLALHQGTNTSYVSAGKYC